MSKTIILVLPAEPAYSETFFSSKIKGLQNDGHRVILHVGRRTGEVDYCKVVTAPKVYAQKFIQLPVMGLTFLTLFPFASRIIQYWRQLGKSGMGFRQKVERLYLNSRLLKQSADWIHFGFATQGLGREYVAFVLGAKCGLSFRGYDIGIYPLKHPGCYDVLSRKVDRIHYLSEDLWQKALEEGFSNTTERMKITPAIDIMNFGKTIFKDFTAENKIYILTVARLHWKKGCLYAVEAIAALTKRGYDVIYTIVGAGEDYERVAYRAHQLGILDCINFAGQVVHSEVVDYYRDCDIYLQYSVQEGFCNAVIEAQAMGKQVVVSDAEGLSENVDSGHTGWVVPKLRPDLLADRLEQVINLSPDSKRRFGRLIFCGYFTTTAQ